MLDALQVWQPGALGRAATASSMSPEEAINIKNDLEKARSCLVLSTDLHLLYLVSLNLRIVTFFLQSIISFGDELSGTVYIESNLRLCSLSTYATCINLWPTEAQSMP